MTAVSTTLAIQMLEIYIDNNQPVAIWGPPGIGKTQIPAQVAKRRGMMLVDFRANLHDPVDMHGLPVPDMVLRTTDWLRPSTLPFVGNDAFPETGILLLDEVNTASPSMQNACLQLVQERRVGEHVLKAGWVIVATGNRAKDKAHVTRLSSALKNRFAHIEFEPDIEAWSKWAVENKVDIHLIAFLRFKKDLLHKMPASDDINAFPTPRQWSNVAQYVKQPKDIRVHLVSGLVGRDAAVDLEGFLRVYHELPTLKSVIEEPLKAKVPSEDEPSARYAITAMLAHGADRKTFKPILQYAARLGTEFEVLAAVDAVRLHPELQQTSEFGTWIVKHQDVTI